MAPPHGQSKFVAEAVEYFIERKRRQVLRQELIEGYEATSEGSLTLAKEWEAVDIADWLKHVLPYEGEGLPDDKYDWSCLHLIPKISFYDFIRFCVTFSQKPDATACPVIPPFFLYPKLIFSQKSVICPRFI